MRVVGRSLPCGLSSQAQGWDGKWQEATESPVAGTWNFLWRKEADGKVRGVRGARGLCYPLVPPGRREPPEEVGPCLEFPFVQFSFLLSPPRSRPGHRAKCH